jgi:hypothetical protein
MVKRFWLPVCGEIIKTSPKILPEIPFRKLATVFIATYGYKKSKYFKNIFVTRVVDSG